MTRLVQTVSVLFWRKTLLKCLYLNEELRSDLWSDSSRLECPSVRSVRGGLRCRLTASHKGKSLSGRTRRCEERSLLLLLLLLLLSLLMHWISPSFRWRTSFSAYRRSDSYSGQFPVDRLVAVVLRMKCFLNSLFCPLVLCPCFYQKMSCKVRCKYSVYSGFFR